MKQFLPIFSILVLVFSSCGNPAQKDNKDSGNTVRVHYKRLDNSYSGWGIHLWNVNGADPAIADSVGTEWTSPRPFEGTDSFGVYTDIPVLDITKGLNFIIHKGETKDISSDRTFPTSGEKEFWIISGVTQVFTENPGNTALLVNIDTPKTVKGQFTNAFKSTDVVKLLNQDGTDTGLTPVISGNLVTFSSPTDLRSDQLYLLDLNGLQYEVGYSAALLQTTDFVTYAGTDLGASFPIEGTNVGLKLWSPTARAVTVQFYQKANQNAKLGEEIPLVREGKGVWSKTVTPADLEVADLDGTYYQYRVTAGGVTKPALDPYAKSMAAFLGSKAGSSDYVGKAAVVDLENATLAGALPSANTSTPASKTDVVIYEVHIRDFTVQNDDVATADQGTFKGFMDPDAIAHLKDLGVTHVQLLPVNNHFRVDETVRSYQGEISNPNYNWGYDPHNYFTLEGQYSTNPSDPYIRIKEFRAMVDALHENGIGVIMDVVFNHTFNNSVFNDVAPGLYYRPAGGATPVSDPAVESRNLMVRKFIIDNLKHWKDNFGIDGFRFDLMGFIDVTTMEEIRTALGSSSILHGEAWDFTDLPAADKTVKGNKAYYPYSSDIALFNDTIRDSVKGSSENGHQAEKGFIQGSGNLAAITAGILAGIDSFDQASDPGAVLDNGNAYRYFAKEPSDSIQYLEVHDGFTLWDKLNFTVTGNPTARARAYKQASAMLFTSQGKILIQAGMEFGRTKPLATNDPEPTRAATAINTGVNADQDVDGKTKFHNNTYSSSDFTNRMRWNRMDTAPYQGIFSYYQGLIEMRRNIPALRFSSAANIDDGLTFYFKPVGDAPIGTPAGYTTIAQAKDAGTNFTIKFVNGPAGQTYYLVGEVFSSNQNPLTNTYAVTFNGSGEGSISLPDAAFDNFDPDLDIWEDDGNLNVKLVKTRGSWDPPTGAYSGTGNNSIRPSAILDDNSVTIDLNIQDYVPGTVELDQNVIAYELDNSLDSAGSGTAFTKLIVAHNGSDSEVTIDVPSATAAGWTVILDDDEAGISAVGTISPAGITMGTGTVTVPAKTSVVWAK